MSFTYHPHFVAEGYTDGDERWNDASPLLLEAKDTWYGKHFYQKEHQNYIITEADVGVCAISIAADNTFYRIMIRSVKDGVECFKVTRTDVKVSGTFRRIFRRPPSCKDIIEFCKPELRGAHVVKVSSVGIIERLYQLEEPKFDKLYRIGLVYAGAEQTTESEMYSNVAGSERWDEFLDFLGSKVQLKGFDRYDGGLDTKNNMTGEYSLFSEWREAEVMFHVSTMLPFLPADPQQLARKKHIGNDRCVIIFRDGDAPVSPNVIASKQLHILAVVSPHEVVDGETKSYQFAVASRDTMPPYDPDMPNPPIFPKDDTFRDFLFEKLTNGVVATRYAAEFAALMNCLYSTRLGEIVNAFS